MKRDAALTICGIHSGGHDTGLALLSGGEFTFAVETERITRRKHESDVSPALTMAASAIQQCRNNLIIAASTKVSPKKLGIEDWDEVRSAEQLRQTLFAETSAEIAGVRRDCVIVAHEASHAALACQAGGWRDNTLVLVNEGGGTFSRNSLFRWKAGQLCLLETDILPWYASGFGWAIVAYLFGLGWSPSAAGKLMALAGYSDDSTFEESWLLSEIPANLHHCSRSDQDRYGERLAALTGNSFRRQASFASALQNLFTRTVMGLLEKKRYEYGAEHIALGGGCALNLHTNTMIRKLIDAQVAISPACNDSGQALGAALFVARCIRGEATSVVSPWINGSSISSLDSENCLRSQGATPEPFNSKKVANVLAHGGVVAFADGRSAIGPRSLGERSLLAHPGMRGQKEIISVNLKGRQWFRPLAPVMRLESFSCFFPGELPSPTMLFEYSHNLTWLREATHIDGTSRVQTIDDSHPSLHFKELLEDFYHLTDIPALINTSLNRAGRAIAATGDQVLEDFGLRDVEAVVLGDHMCVSESSRLRRQRAT